MSKHIRLKRFYPYPVDQVWGAIADADALGQWLMPNDFKLEKGHRFCFRSKPQPGFDGLVRCEVLDFEIPRRLQFSWQGGPMKKATVVSFTLDQVEGGTELQFEHSGFEGFVNEYIVRFILGNGWKKLLGDKILTYLAG